MARVLVVDDEPDLRFLVRKLLEKDGHEVLEAPNGRVALQALDGGTVDVVITDTTMPVMDGAELIAALRQRSTTADVAVIIWSDNPERESDADEVFAKPYGGPEIADAVARLAQRS